VASNNTDYTLWKSGERRLATEEVWDRLRREPELPMLLKPTDLLPHPVGRRDHYT